MIRIVGILLSVISFLSCDKNENNKTKYDYVSSSVLTSNVKYYSILQSVKDSIVVKDYYLGLDSTNRISIKSNFQTLEHFNEATYFLYGAIQLKENKKYLGTTWRSPRDDNYYDSLSVSLVNVIDTIFSDVRFKDCFVYDIKYDRNSGEDFLDFKIYFDFEKKALLKKVYYQNLKIKGKEEVIRIISQ